VQATIQDTPRLLSVKSGDWGGYAALGASAHALVSTPMTLDLAATERVNDEERRTARDIMLAGAAASVVLAGMGLLKSATYSYRSQELRKYPLAADVKAVIGGKSPAQIDGLLMEMQKQLNDVRPLAETSRPKMSVIMREIISLMPDKLWLTHITISDALDAEAGVFHLTLSGHVQDQTAADEQAVAFKFKDDLIKSPLLGRWLDVSLSIQKDISSNAESNMQGLDPEKLRKNLESRTQFTMEITAKR